MVSANSTLADLHDVGVWNDSVGTNTDSLIQPSVPCEKDFSTGTWDVSSTAFNFQQISHVYDGKSNVHTSLKKVSTLEIFRD